MTFNVLKIRRSKNRFHSVNEWLDSRHTFDFGKHESANWKNFGAIQVINEDIIAPNAGFQMHPHKNMEIITIVTEGCLTHRDSLNNTGEIFSNQIQLITAGNGILHSERNEKLEVCKLLQIWISTKIHNLTPCYQKKTFCYKEGLQEIINPKNEENTLLANQDIYLWRYRYSHLDKFVFPNQIKRFNWLQVIEGGIEINNFENIKVFLDKGDGIGFALDSLNEIFINTHKNSDILLFSMMEI